MALSAAIVWEVRTTGSQNNGGGFKTGATGTDYSQQAAAQYALNPVTSGGASAVMINANAAAVMVGNVCRVVSGTNATAGWYEIISVNVGVDITVDRNWCTGVCNDGVVNVGGAFKIGGSLDNEFSKAVVAGNTIYIPTGTYTLGEAWGASTAGTVTAPISWIGYKTTRNDICAGDDRPYFVCGTNNFLFGTWNIIKNIRGTSADDTGLRIGDNGYTFNCKFINTGGANYQAFSFSGYTRALACEGMSANGFAFNGEAGNHFYACYAHDSNCGFQLQSHNSYIGCSIVDNCAFGVLIGGASYLIEMINNTIYDCTTGISATSCNNSNFVNNIITDCVTGANWTTASPNNFWDYNCWNNTTDVVNVTKGPHCITDDPRLRDPANGDFRLKGGSPCFATGMSLSSDVGLA